jgi:tRNA(Ile)-lysidine synthase
MSSRGQHENNDLAAELLDQARRLDFEDFLLRRPLVLGVSGGADSLAMLHLLCALRGDAASATLHVAHLNHWFRAKESQEDADFVERIAREWSITSTVETVDVPNFARRYKLSAEDAARRVRYDFLRSVALERGADVAVAHNADDQVETILMSILRGTGLAGLAGMQVISNLPPAAATDTKPTRAISGATERVVLFRPLLHVWRHRIVEHCKQQGLEPRFDATNWERTYRRNRVRHDLIPLLQMQYSLAIKEHLFNLADIANEENALLNILTESEWARAAHVSPDGSAVSFDTEAFPLLAVALRRRLVRRAIETVAGTLQDFGFEHIEAAVSILSAAPGSPAAHHLPHDLAIIRTGRQGRIESKVGVVEARSASVVTESAWPLLLSPGCTLHVTADSNVALEHGWTLCASLTQPSMEDPPPGDFVACFDADRLPSPLSLTLRTRRAHDTIRPMGMAGSKSLQDLMVDAKIPRELRDKVAVVAMQGLNDVLWVPGPGGRRSSHALITEQTKRVLLLTFVRPAQR